MTISSEASLANSITASPETNLKQLRETKSQQGLSRDLWSEMGKARPSGSRSDHAADLGLPNLAFVDSRSSGNLATDHVAADHVAAVAQNPLEPVQPGGPGAEDPLRPAPEAKTTATPTDTSTASKTATTSDTTSTSSYPGVGSTATTFGTNAMPEASQTAPGFYVSPTGTANGDGSEANPFATLQQAQQAMENSTTKTTYVEGGTYIMGSTLNLTSADSGEAFISVGGASNPAVLDGGGKLSDLISLNAANNVKIEGFSMQNTSNDPVWSDTNHGQVNANTGAIFAENSTGDTFGYNSMNNVDVGVNMQGDSDRHVAQNSITNAQSGIDSGSSANNVYGSNNTIQGNLVENITGYGEKLFDNVGAININGDTNSTINNNVIENTAGVGLQMNFREAGSGFTAANNTILNTDYLATTAKADTNSNPVGDDGAIHVITAPGSTKDLNGVISNNYIDGAGANRADKAVYLDDGVNGVTVSDNVLEEGAAGYAMQIHGGSNNTVDGNTFLLDSTGGGLLYQTDGFQMTGNTIENNTFTATGNSQSAYSFLNTDSSDLPTFLDNIYSRGLSHSQDPN
jgi:parallel beta-helix repeat protein